jgi:hypothetical protein
VSELAVAAAGLMLHCTGMLLAADVDMLPYQQLVRIMLLNLIPACCSCICLCVYPTSSQQHIMHCIHCQIH